jgi:pheromone shutdown protein TraB
MEENIYRIQVGEKDIVLIATAHVSQESVNLVKTVIESEQA